MTKIEGEGKILFNGRFTQVREYILKNEGKEDIEYECVIRSNAVTAIVFNPQKNKYLFVRQFRVGAGKDLVELAAGMLDKENEDPKEAIIREIEEELGYSVNESTVKLLSEFYSSPGGFKEKMFLYYVETLEKINDGGGLEDENIHIIEMTREEVIGYVFEDAKTVIGQLLVASS
jgi:ADP-ribose pyrophosphatase